jgi:hypothetical protein
MGSLCWGRFQGRERVTHGIELPRGIELRWQISVGL